MISELFPDSARWQVLHVEGISLARYRRLPAEEQELVARAVDKRKAEFGDARWCAHRALEQLVGEESNAPILRGPRGMPLWPEGITGSLSHTEGVRAAVVAPLGPVRALGLDVEPAQPLPSGVLGSIALPREAEAVEKWREEGMAWADRLLFCAKEATYKAWFPLTRRWLDFDQADIRLRRDGTFTSYLLVRPSPVPLFQGRWLRRDGHCYAAIAVPG